jgi:hypothetical protein
MAFRRGTVYDYDSANRAQTWVGKIGTQDTELHIDAENIKTDTVGDLWVYVLKEVCGKEDHNCPVFEEKPKTTRFRVNGYMVPILPCPLCKHFSGIDWPKVVKAEELDRKLGKGEGK